MNKMVLSSGKLRREVYRQIYRELEFTAGHKMPQDATGSQTKDEELKEGHIETIC